MAVQFAQCCRPIPGDPIIGVIKSGQGLLVHTHDCPTLRRGRSSGEQWLDVAWDKNINRPFDVNIKLLVANQRGVLAKISAAIAEAEANIENINFTHEGEYSGAAFHAGSEQPPAPRQHHAQLAQDTGSGEDHPGEERDVSFCWMFL